MANMKTFMVVIVSFLSLIVKASPDIPEEDLLDELFYNYNKDARPATRETPTIYVKHGLSLLRIVSIKNNIATIDAWQNLQWNDPRLTWMPSDYFETNSISLVVHKVWKPDILLYNIAGSDDGYIYKNVNVIVHHSGIVTWVPMIRLVTYCDDTDTNENGEFRCSLKFGSWTLDESKLNVTNYMRNSSNNATEVDLSNFIESKEFFLVNTEVQLNEQFYECCPEPYQDITYNLIFKKKSTAQSDEQTTTIATTTEKDKKTTTATGGSERRRKRR